MAFTLPALPLRLTDANGNILAGAKMYVFEAGTTTPTDCYTSSALSVAHPNPLVADSGGMFEEAFFSAGTYKIRFTTAGDATIWEVDNYNVPETGSTISFPSEVKTANFTLTSADRAKVFQCDASGAPGSNIVITADSETLGNDFPFWVVNSGASGTITVQGTGSQTINGQPSLVLSLQYASAGFVSGGAVGWTKFATSGAFPSTDIGDSTAAGRAVLKASTALAQAQIIPSSIITGASRGLSVTNNATTPNSVLDISATELVVRNSDGLSVLLSNVSTSVNIATSGAGGLDTGTEANSTWYYVWLVYNGSTVSGLLSVSAATPTMPSGYTYKALVGCVRNDSSGNFVKMRGVGPRVYQEPIAVLSNVAPTSAKTFQNLSIASGCPPAAVMVSAVFGIVANSFEHFGVRADTNSIGLQVATGSSASGFTLTVAGVALQSDATFRDIPLTTSQQIAWTNSTGNNTYIFITDFVLPIPG